MLARPRSGNSDTQAVVRECDRLWTVYRSLSTSRRQTLPASIKRQVLRRIVPPWQMVSRLAWQHDAKEDSAKEGPTGECSNVLGASAGTLRWEQRLALVMSDLGTAAITSTAEGDGPSLHDYNFVVHHFAALGHIAGCETLAREMAARGFPINIKTANCRLAAISRWLALQKPIDVVAGDLLARQTLGLVKKILAELRYADVPLRRLTVDHLFRIVVRLRKDFAPSLSMLDELFEEILERGYAVAATPLDIIGAPPVDTASESALPAVSMQTLNLILRDLGSRGLMWEMISAFSSLGECRPPIPWRLRVSDELDASVATGPSTLSEALLVEQEGPERLSFFGRTRRTADASSMDAEPSPALETSRAFHDYLSHIPLSSASFRQFSSPNNSFPPPFLLHSYHRPRQPGVNTETFTVLIHHIVARGDFQLALHALRSGIREARAVRTEWYAAYGHALRQSTSSATTDLRPLEAGKIHQQLLRPSVAIDPGWFKRVLRTAHTPNALAIVLRELRTAQECVDDELRLWTELRDTVLQDAFNSIPKLRVRRDPLAFDFTAFTRSIEEQSISTRSMIATTEARLQNSVARRMAFYAKRKQLRAEAAEVGQHN